MPGSVTMSVVGKHSGEPTEESAPPPRQRLLLLAAGVTATMVAWGFLVWEAIDFGDKARDGQSAAWLFLFLATVGATACMFMTLVLGNKVLRVLRGDPTPVRTTPPGGRRAAR
ncbi:MAG: hypothetical protein JWQ74_2903 [Marmoricola sp.]|nr:hypothetical protein [Marmoricola sp.]